MPYSIHTHIYICVCVCVVRVVCARQHNMIFFLTVAGRHPERCNYNTVIIMLCANYSRRTKSHIMSREASNTVYLLPINYIHSLLRFSLWRARFRVATHSRSFLVIVIMYDDEDDRPDHESKVRREMTCPSVCVIFYLFIFFPFLLLFSPLCNNNPTEHLAYIIYYYTQYKRLRLNNLFGRRK